MKKLEIVDAELSFLDKNPFLILKLINDCISIDLSQQTLERLYHLLTVASLEKGEQNDKA